MNTANSLKKRATKRYIEKQKINERYIEKEELAAENFVQHKGNRYVSKEGLAQLTCFDWKAFAIQTLSYM